MNHLPKPTIPASLGKAEDSAIQFSPLLAEVAELEKSGVFSRMKTAPGGLSEEKAASRLAEIGPNVVAVGKHRGWPWRLFTAARNPLVILLTVLATISFATGDVRAGTVMLLMVVLGVLLRFVQETRADTAAAKLKAMISVTATVVRDGQASGDPAAATGARRHREALRRRHGPGDVRLLSAKDLFVIQATLTGESMPVEKTDAPETRAEAFRRSSARTSASSAPAWRAARPPR